MRNSLRLAVILTIFSSHALAAKGKKNAPAEPVTTMDQGADPTSTEQSEKKAPKVEPPTDEEIAAQEAKADAAAVKKRRQREQVGLFANVLVGFGSAPMPGTGADVTTGKTTSGTLMVGGYYDLSPDFTLGARLPLTVGSQRQPDGGSETVVALGILELMGEYRTALSRFTVLPVSFGLGLPTAQGNYDYLDKSGWQRMELNTMADAAAGYRDPELFGPHRLPVIGGVGVDYQRKALSLRAATKLVLGIKVGGELANVPDTYSTYELKPVTIRSVTSGGVSYEFLPRPRVFAALDAWLAYNAINAFEYTSKAGATPPTRFQFVFEPRVGARFGKVSPSIGYIFPIGGRLADAGTSGLELHCDFAF
ncbi:MAG TPA: hypothetical protein VFK05_36880 [Polyangiaceae bacterium]|nr:hypothetical protein [Polyangiaceae bacterium]